LPLAGLLAAVCIVGVFSGPASAVAGAGVGASAQAGDRPAAAHPLRVLLITAHPDDETMFDMGRFRERGWDVSIALVTNGENGGVVEGIVAGLDPGSTQDVLVEHDPAPGVWLTRPPAGPPLREISTHVALARERRQEFLASQAINGVTRVFFLSGLQTSDFEDSWDNGVRNWDIPLLEDRLLHVVQRVRPDVIVTLNPDETWAHRQHWGLARIVRQMYSSGRFDLPGEPTSVLYGIREHGWYDRSLVPQRGDERFDRTASSAVLGATYADAWTAATSAYISQSSHPVWFAARVAAGLLPGYSTFDLIRRLDRSSRPGLTALFAEHPPDRVAMAALPARPQVIHVTRAIKSAAI
jgi:LmbE family N-acetylglucosaminyl deacetylase